MASEDSDEVVPGFPVIHRLGDASDLDETVAGSVPTRRNHVHAHRESVEIEPLRRSQRVFPEERNDRLHEIHPSRHDVPGTSAPCDCHDAD